MSESTSNDSSMSKRKSYIGFLKDLVKLKAVPQLLFIFAMTSFGSGMINNIAPAVITDSFARNFYNYTGPLCSSIDDAALLPKECELATSYGQSVASVAALVKASIAFFVSPLLGSLSDRRGRKYLFMLGIFLSILPQVALLFILLFPTFNPISYYIATAVTGISVYFFTAFAIMSDVTKPSDRVVAFSLLLVCGASAISLSQGIDIFFGNVSSVAVSVGIAVFTLIFLVVFLPETVPAENMALAKSRYKEEQEEGVTLWKKMFRTFYDISILNRSLLLRLVGVVLFLSSLVKAGVRTLFLFYMESQLGFTEQNVATYVLFNTFGGLLTQSIILNELVQRFGERRVIIIAMVCGALSCLLYEIARHPWLVYIGAAIFSLSGVDNATMSSILSYNVEEYEQGLIQGVNGAVSSFAGGLGPLFLNYISSKTEDGAFLGPGTFFFVAVVFFGLAAITAYFFPPEEANSKRFLNGDNSLTDGLLSENNVLPILGTRRS